MSDLKVFRWTGAFWLATVVFAVNQFSPYMVGNASSVYDALGTSQHLTSISTIALTRILLDQGVYVSMMVFAAGFRHVIQTTRQDYEWLRTLLLVRPQFGWRLAKLSTERDARR